MRRPAYRLNRGQVSRTYSVPAPTRGWNARDSVAAMRKGDAALLTNFFPLTSDVILRQGVTQHVTGIDSGAQVETLVSYRPTTGSNKLFAFTPTKLFDVSTAGAAGAAVVSSLTNGRWQTTNFTTVGGNFIICVNGADKPLLYNGTTWTAVDGASTPAITGVTSTLLTNVNVFKQRCWYVETASFNAWYSAAGAMTGALTKFDMSGVFKKGGYLMAMANWTVDGGDGLDDLAVFISSQGEVAVYQGTDPTSASTFALVGIYNIAAPIGRRCTLKYGPDLLIITVDGVIPASKAFMSGRTNSAIAISDRISGAVTAAASSYGANFGWQLTQFSEAGMLLLNVPNAVGQQQQFVMNTTTGAWANFTGWYANCFEVFNGGLYYGTAGEVRHAWNGLSDNGAQIVGDMAGAFDYFGNRDGLKQIMMLRPVIAWDTNPGQMLVGVDTDFAITTPLGVVAFPTGGGSLWDSGLWDSAVWGGGTTINKDWYGATGVGYAIAPRLKVATNNAQIRVSAFDYLYQPGGVL
ncbi:MAG TPA: hypothetical protein VFA39_15630 [Steroidobacteraceae bacterium]|nr:hypothetical protein [Steroidobacteraceae bacterium]